MNFLTLQPWLTLAAGSAVLLLPGAAIAAVLMRGESEPLPRYLRRIAPAAPALSLSFWPLLLLYMSLPGLRITLPAIWVVLIISAGIAGWYIARVTRSKLSPATSAPPMVVALCLGLLCVIGLAFRLADVNGLPVPLFGDSMHHTMITSIIASTGQVPRGYEPYAPIDSFTYHFGFHTLAAVTSVLSGATPADSVLLVGQLLIVLAIPAAYLMSRGLFGSRMAGLAAALLTGFVSIMPAYYVNWGRYTQLAGQIILPLAVVAIWRASQPGASRSSLVLLAFLVAGLSLVHYRILIFLGLFAVSLFIWQLFLTRQRGAVVTAWTGVTVAGIAGMAAVAPWWWNLLRNYVPGLVSRLGSVTPEYLAQYDSAETLRVYLGLAVPALALLGVAASLLILFSRARMRAARPKLTLREAVRSTSGTVGPEDAREERGNEVGAAGALILATWSALIVLSIWVVPGAIGSYTVAITLYIPLTALGGYGVAAALDPLISRVKHGYSLAAVALTAGAPLLALALGTWHVTDPGHYLYVHPADLQAMDWIKARLPGSAKFLISSELSYAGRGVTASDAGMWIPMLTGRTVSVPALPAWAEHPETPTFFTDTRKLAALSQPAGSPDVASLVKRGVAPKPVPPGDPQMLELMRRLGITHVYSGAAGGASKPRLDVEAMRRDRCHYRLAYPADSGVYIFAVDYAGAYCK